MGAGRDGDLRAGCAPDREDRRGKETRQAKWLDGREYSKDSRRTLANRLPRRAREAPSRELRHGKDADKALTEVKTRIAKGDFVASSHIPKFCESVNAVLTTAAAIFKLAVRRKLVTSNPVADAERAFMGANEIKDKATKQQRGDGVQPLKPEEVLDPNEIRRMLEKAEPGFYRTLFLTAYLTGMRSGEPFALRWPDIELKGTDSRDREAVISRSHLRSTLAFMGAREKRRRSGSTALLSAEN